MTTSPESPAASAAQHWSLARLLTFRFFFVYFVLFVPPSVSWLLPGGSVIERAYNSVAFPATAWIASRVIGYTQPLRISHGSDTAYNFIEKLLLVLVAATIAGLWTVMSRRRSHVQLRAWTRVGLRWH